MKYLAKYENEPLSLYGFAVIDEWKKDEMQAFNKGRFGEDFLRENCD